MLVSKLAVIEEFAKDARLKTSLKNELRAAIQYTTERSGLSWNDKQNILSELPKKLRYELALAMHQGAAKALDFFQGKDPVFVSAMVPFMQPLLIKANEPIFRQGEYADETYFIVHGRVSYILEEGGFVYKSLHQGSYFGDIEIIMMIPRKYSVSAAIDSNLLTMKKPLLETIEADFPAYWKEMQNLAEARDKVNDKARKEFTALMALKKAGKLEKSNPESVRKKVQRLNSISTNPQQPSPRASVTIETLNSLVLESIESVKVLETEVKSTREVAEAVLNAVKTGGIREIPHRGKLRKLFAGKGTDEKERDT